MKNRNIFFLSLKNFGRNKHNIISIILISISFTLILFAISFSESIHNYWKVTKKSIVNYRSYFVIFDDSQYSIEEAKKILSEEPHVLGVSELEGYLISMKANNSFIDEENGFFLIGTVNNPMPLISGKDFSAYPNEQNIMICPKQFYPFNELYSIDYSKERALDISNKSGEIVSLSHLSSDKEENFRIVGLYDAEKSHHFGNVCYAPFETVKRLNLEYQYDVFYHQDKVYCQLYIVIDNKDNEELVFNSLEKKDIFYDNPVVKLNTKVGDNIIMTTSVFAIIFLIISISINFLINLKDIIKNKEQYGIMKIYGFSNSSISFSLFIQLFLTYFMALLLSTFLYILAVKFFNVLYLDDKVLFYDFKMNYSFIALLVNLFLSILMSLFTSLFGRKKVKNTSSLNMIGARE